MERFERRLAPGPVDEVVGLGAAFASETDAEQGEVVLRVDDAGGLRGEVLDAQAGAVDAEVGELRRFGGGEGDDDLLPSAGPASSFGCVLAILDVDIFIDEDLKEAGG